MIGIFGSIRNGALLGSILIGVVALAKWIISIILNSPKNWMDKTLPVVSMAGIVFIIAIITARSSEKLLSVGLLLIAVAIVHNFIGYVAGYWLARLARLDERSCRTVAFEVGMQNGGMATGLAMTVLNSAKAALAPAIFGGSLLIKREVIIVPRMVTTIIPPTVRKNCIRAVATPRRFQSMLSWTAMVMGVIVRPMPPPMRAMER